MKTIVDFLIYVVVRGSFTFLGLLPRMWAHPLCRGVATLIYGLDAKHQRIGMINLEIAFPDSSPEWRKETLLKSFQQLGDLAVEISRLPRLSRSEVGKRVQYEPGRGLENYLEAKRFKGSVLFVTAHISAWELLPSAHALLGNSLNFVVRPLDNRFLEVWVSGLRSRFGNQTIPKQRALRQTLKFLKRGLDVGFLLDQNVQEKDGVFVPLFGRPASTSSAVARLSLKTGLPVVLGFIYPKEGYGNFGIRFYPPMFPRSGTVSDSEIEWITSEINGYIEEMIRDFPHCWLWGHRRFSTQPDKKSPYEKS